jgi:hypothetical protein
MDARSHVDSIFHPQLFTEQHIDEMPRYAQEFGIRSFKFYMSGMPGIVKSVTDDVMLRGFRRAAAIGRWPKPLRTGIFAMTASPCVRCHPGSPACNSRFNGENSLVRRARNFPGLLIHSGDRI